MVAISTDSPRFTFDTADEHGTRTTLWLAPAGPVDSLSPLARLLLVVAAVVAVVAVAVGSVAFGRMLDTQRGIPASPAAASSVTAAP
jgi:hypothetical protein